MPEYNKPAIATLTDKSSPVDADVVLIEDSADLWQKKKVLLSELKSAAGLGDVDGPNSSTDNAVPRFDGTTGKLIQNTSTFTIDDDGKPTETITLNDASGNEVAHTINYTTNKAAGNDTGLVINMTDTASPGTSLGFECKHGANSVLAVDMGNERVGIGTTSPSQLLQLGTGEFGGATISKQFSNKCAADLLGILTYPKALYTWQGTPGNGLTESDLSGAGHTATYIGAGWAAANKLNKGFGFVLNPDGASYINLGDSDDFSFAAGNVDGAFSMGGAFEVVDTATYQIIVSKFDATTGAELREWRVYLDPSETLTIVLFDESLNVQCYRITNAALSVGWHTWAITCSSVSAGALRANDILFYVDGVVVASTATNDANYVSMENLAVPCWIGADDSSGVGVSPEYYMQGDIGIQMIDKGVVWSAEDVWQMYMYLRSLYAL